MKPILYRAGSKRSLIAAFCAAAAIHVSALAFSPSHRPEPIGPNSPEVILEPAPAEPEPSPPPEEIQPPEVTPAPAEPNDFADLPQPTPRRLARQSRPIHSRSAPNMAKLAVGNGKVTALNAPRPDYPYEARAHHVTGSGMVLLEVDPTSGAVLNATMTQSTGSSILDSSAMSAFRRWRFRSGTPTQVRIPFTFTMSGAQL